MPETLYLTVNLIDRFLEAKQVTRKHLQLVGVTAMLVASKYEEIWAPEVRDFVYISDRAYTRDQILNMEKIMLNCLRFNLTVPSECAADPGWGVGVGGACGSSRGSSCAYFGMVLRPARAAVLVCLDSHSPGCLPRRHLQLPGPQLQGGGRDQPQGGDAAGHLPGGAQPGGLRLPQGGRSSVGQWEGSPPGGQLCSRATGFHAYPTHSQRTRPL